MVNKEYHNLVNQKIISYFLYHGDGSKTGIAYDFDYTLGESKVYLFNYDKDGSLYNIESYTNNGESVYRNTIYDRDEII